MRISLVTAGLAIAASGPSAQTFRQKDFDAYVNRGLERLQIPGAAVAVVKDGKLLFAKGYGVRTLGDTGRVDAHTLFQIASNTKAFTTAALAMLVDEGKLAWDDPVTKYLPDFQLYDPYVTREFTIRDLVTHRSGLGLGAGDLLWFHSNYDRAEIIHRIRAAKPASSFRSRYAYDNVLYIAAGEIVAAVSEELGRLHHAAHPRPARYDRERDARGGLELDAQRGRAARGREGQAAGRAARFDR